MALASLLLATALSSTATAQRGAANGEWRSYHGDQGSLRYSPLDQITRDNVRQLREVWRFRTDDFGPKPEYKNEAAPLYVNGTLYMTAGLDRAVVALDPATGVERWRWSLEEGERAARAPRRNSGRGVSYWEDGKGDARIIVVTPGFHLVALDARTGKPIPSFGPSGIVDLKRDLGRGAFDPLAPVGSSSPVVISRDTIVVGPALELGFRPKTMANVPGFVRGFDVRTGVEKWRFQTIPQAGEKYVETWENGSWKYSGNAGVWAPFSADDELGYVYLPVEAGTSDLYGGHRLGDNVYSSSLVCLDVRTGKVVWHFQQIHHDIWDYDNTTAPMLMDVTIDGRPRKIVALFTKQAFTYVFDRVTGEPIWPIVERAVPASDVPGERTSKTQPFPTRPPAFDRQGFTLDDVVDFTPEVRARAIEALKPFRLGAMYAPPSLTTAADGTRGTLILPGVQGGAQWEHGAADPDTGVIYIASATQPSLVALEKSADTDLDYVAARGAVPSVDGIPITKPPYGRITAIDLKTGTIAWQVANGDTPPAIRDHPLLKGVTLPRTGSRSRAGLLATRTLLFAGEGWGGQPYFRALDKQTGATLWEVELAGVQTGLPMTYLHQGRQYIAFTVGDQDRLPAQLVAYALPDGQGAPPLRHRRAAIHCGCRAAAGPARTGRLTAGVARRPQPLGADRRSHHARRRRRNPPRAHSRRHPHPGTAPQPRRERGGHRCRFRCAPLRRCPYPGRGAADDRAAAADGRVGDPAAGHPGGLFSRARRWAGDRGDAVSVRRPAVRGGAGAGGGVVGADPHLGWAVGLEPDCPAWRERGLSVAPYAAAASLPRKPRDHCSASA
jgi:quinoprotein glucose dehydrogenase